MEYIATCGICGDKLIFYGGNVYILGNHLIRKHEEVKTSHFEVESRNNGNNKNGNKATFKIESWRPGTCPISCPKCGSRDTPYIKKQRNKVASNALGALILLGCWPLCFLPLLMCGTTSILVCCKKCGYCLGTYDKKKGTLTPAEIFICDC